MRLTDFYYRFVILAPSGVKFPLPIGPDDDARELCRRLLHSLKGHELFQQQPLESGIRFGASKLFLKKSTFKCFEVRCIPFFSGHASLFSR